ncbi:hypothetical protein [Streptomyces sp. CT34]|uniref:hypothetical protein n=1 Tax=Streptomyces sp. CT34 TaxID=1553907 RepID=UPI001F51B1AF|nr:hypothetical protein [Streptomyces sp. CT34]
MSNTGDQNNPYNGQPQQGPYGPAPAPPNPLPAQQNPYGQQNPPAGAPPQAPGSYGYPAVGAAGAPGAPGAPGTPGISGVPGAPVGNAPGTPIGAAPGALIGAAGVPGIPAGAPPGGIPGGTGRGASGWLWALGGAVAATAIGASVMFATGGFSSEPSPDLKGYAYKSDLCAATSMTPFENAHFQAKPGSGSTGAGASGSSTENPQHSGVQQPSMDTMWCNVTLTPDSAGTAGYSSTWLYNTVTLHKKSDPAPEFADSYRSWEKQEASVHYKVESVPGIGNEAYLVTRDDASNNNGSYVMLAARDGWLTYQSTWSGYTSSTATSKPPTTDEITTMLETSAKDTLHGLKG